MTFREIWLRLTYPLHSRRLRSELREEMQTHIELRSDQLERNGLSGADAALAARRRFGNVSRIADSSRAAWGWHWADAFLQDLRHVVRQLRRSPGFVLVTVLTIGLGVGINTAAFTFYDAVVLKPLPVRAPDEMVRIVQDASIPNAEALPFEAYRVLHANSRSVGSVIATSGAQPLSAILPGRSPDDQRSVIARFVSPDYFSALGVHPLYGRTFDDADQYTAVISHDFWTRALDADPRAIGGRLTIHDVELTIIGITPPAFAGTGLPASAPDLWVPLDRQPSLVPGADWRHDQRPHWQILARVTAGAVPTQLAAELSTLQRAVPDSLGKPVALLAKHATFFQAEAGEFDVFQQASVIFMTALALILGIGTVNLVNLVAARNAAREREMGVRLALGASRGRIARQLATESLLLGVAGGALGLATSWWMATTARDWLLSTLQTISGGLGRISLDLTIDWRIVAYAALLATVVGLGVGALPALRAARSDVNAVLKEGSHATSGRATWSTHNLLLVTQIAGCVVLLAAAGMLLSGVRRARDVSTGFEADHMLLVVLDAGSDGAKELSPILRQVEARMTAMPEVQSIAWTDRVPFGGTHLRTAQTPRGRVTVSIRSGSAAYFAAAGIPLLSGRAFSAAEVERNAPVVVISQSLARLHWPGESPIGKSLPPTPPFAGPDSTRPYVVIGVASDVRSNFLSRVDGPAMYFPQPLDRNRGMFIVRTRESPRAAIRPVLAALTTVSPVLAARWHALGLIDGPMAVQRLMAETPAVVSLALAVLGLTLASVGVYGLISQIVVRRTREIGIHMALGATANQVIATVVRKTLRPVAWGAVIGLAGALGVSSVLHAVIATSDMPDLTYGGGAFNPAVFGAVLVALALVVVAACYVPARRAAVVDPTVALRSE